MGRFAVLPVVLTLSGCAGAGGDRTQEIALATNPAGADCRFEQQGVNVARVNPTPGAAVLDRARGHLVIVCNKKGFYQAIYRNTLPTQEGTLGERVSGTLAGWGISSGSGAPQFATPVTIAMTPMPAPIAPLKPTAKPSGPRLQPAPPPVPTPRVDAAPLAGSR